MDSDKDGAPPGEEGVEDFSKGPLSVLWHSVKVSSGGRREERKGESEEERKERVIREGRRTMATGRKVGRVLPPSRRGGGRGVGRGRAAERRTVAKGVMLFYDKKQAW